MNFETSLEENYAKKVTPNPLRAKNLKKASQQAIKTAKNIPLNEETTKSIMRELYEGLRQYFEAIGYEKGYKFNSHETITYFIKDILKNNSNSIKFDKYRKIRNGINYYGDTISQESIKEAIKEITKLTTEDFKSSQS